MNDKQEMRVRIAPSPTGWLHIGTVRSALFNFLLAKKQKGRFILRIEDTDLERSEDKYTKDILEGFKWLGIDYDEGPEKEGEYGPYFQTKRTKTYKPYIEKLLKEKKAYHCYCTKEELEQTREKQQKEGKPPIYNGACRDLSEEQQKEKVKTNPNPVIRFRVEPKLITFKDLVRGKITTDTKTIGDFVIAKNTKTPLYNIAVVIDDETMKISHVIRGEDHIANTPKQILIMEALELEIPQYGHLPLILNTDRSKLSKRQNKVSLSTYKQEGYLPEAMINFMAFLGWNPKTTEEYFTLSELVEKFDIASVNKAGSIFDNKKLDWTNAHYIKQKDITELTDMCIPYLKEKGLITEDKKLDNELLKKIIKIEQTRIKKLSEVGDDTDFLFKQEVGYNKDILIWKKMTKKDVIQSLPHAKKAIEALEENDDLQVIEEKVKQYINENNLQNGFILWPMRVALSGKERSPSPFEIIDCIGKQKSLGRLDQAIKKMTE